MKILLVSHPPLAPELGASQLALNLAAALGARGHDARVWSPEPLPADTRWWNHWQRQRRAVERFVAREGPFDVIDTPPTTATRPLARAARLVVRSIQPELRYLACDLRAGLAGTLVPSPRFAVDGLFAGWRAAAILAAWERADRIVCLGSLELDWMRRRFPRWSGKLRVYACALAEADRAALAEVRRRRRLEGAPGTEGTRFVWIGRWAAHKGTRRLVRFLAERTATHAADRFTLAGCGTAAERDLPPELLRDGRVRIVPAFGRDALPDLLAAHDAGLFTSEVEGWGLCLNEMLEAGLTVYATPAGGVADLRPYWRDRLRPFPPGTANQEENGGAPDLDGYFSHFTWEEIARRYEKEALG